MTLPLSGPAPGGWELGLALGGSIGVAYIVASLLTHRWAARQRNRRFLAIVLGGMVVRMIVALALVGGIAALAPIHLPSFIGAFFATFVVGLAVEVALLHRRGAETPSPDAPPP
ncbi:MAG: hypothetical protein GVY18_06355 [Bacteroidetes bacterium]|jgi:hypothetical protein|nr:hypothetical protein [Bacteroidota bacterium]